MEYPTCDICGAAVADTGRHRIWHDNIKRETKNAIYDALREEARQADLRRRAG